MKLIFDHCLYYYLKILMFKNVMTSFMKEPKFLSQLKLKIRAILVNETKLDISQSIW